MVSGIYARTIITYNTLSWTRQIMGGKPTISHTPIENCSYNVMLAVLSVSKEVNRMFNSNCRGNCVLFSVFVSIIVGIIAAVLRATAVITATVPFLWATFIIAIVYLLALFIVFSVCGTNKSCAEFALPVLLTGILGTVFTSLILLGIDFVATSIIGAVITGLLLIFFSIVITVTACVIKCFVDSKCKDDNCE